MVWSHFVGNRDGIERVTFLANRRGGGVAELEFRECAVIFVGIVVIKSVEVPDHKIDSFGIVALRFAASSLSLSLLHAQLADFGEL